jgi:hypothetical protein
MRRCARLAVCAAATFTRARCAADRPGAADKSVLRPKMVARATNLIMSDDAADPPTDHSFSTEDRELEEAVEEFKEEMPLAFVRMVQLSNPGRTVGIAGRLGDQTWDLGTERYLDLNLGTDERHRIEKSGHHVLPLANGAIGLKISGALLSDEADAPLLEAAAEEFKRQLIARCCEALGRCIWVVTFDIDDTVITDSGRGDDTMRAVPAIAAIHQDMVRHPRLCDLARAWGIECPACRHRVMPVFITARVHTVDGLEMCVRELLEAGLKLPPFQSLYLRPPEASEVDG